MNMHLGRPTTMPRRQQHTTPPTLMLHILCRIHHVGDTTAQGEKTETDGPGTIASLAFVPNVQLPPACGGGGV